MKKNEAKKFADAMALAHDTITDVVPDGWHTAAEIADATGYSYSHALRKVIDAMRKGTMETKKFRIRTNRGIYPVPHYRPKA